MDRLRNLRRQLVKQQDKIIQSMNVHKSLVSALWRLPTEVLSQIFVHCLPATDYLWARTGQAPLLLTRICRRWREVAVGTASLWCRLRVPFHYKDWRRKAFCYDLWLKRSRGYPLSLKVMCFESDTTSLRSLLQPYVNHIRSLDITLSNTNPELVLKDLPALRELTVQWTSHHNISAVAQTISRPPITLRSLKVIGTSFVLEDLSPFIPLWAHLTNVGIAVDHPNTFLRLLHLCPNLSSLMFGIALDHTQALEPLTHTKLQSLRIAYTRRLTNSLPDLFNALSLPNLRVLEARDAIWPHQEFKGLLARSNCPLRSLIFGAGVTTDEQRAEYIALIPSLEVRVDSKPRFDLG